MKIQRIITWSKLMALPLLLVAWTESTELDNIEQTSEEVYPELDFSCESPSRAVVSSFEPGAKIGVFVTDKGTTNGYGGNASNMNITYTLNGDSYWEAGYNTALTNSEANVYGYYPYQSNVSTGMAKLENGVDFLYTPVPSVISRNNPMAEIELNHAMSLLKFNFDASLGNITRISVRSLPASADYNVFTGKVIASSGSTSVDLTMNSPEIAEGFLAIPGYKIDVKVSSDKGSFVWKPGTVTESGKKYNISLSAK